MFPSPCGGELIPMSCYHPLKAFEFPSPCGGELILNRVDDDRFPDSVSVPLRG